MVTAACILLTLARFCLNFFFSAFWALPMNTVPRNLMGVTSGINMAGQLAAFIAPIVIGYLVGIAGRGFYTTFALLIVALLVSCVVLLTIPKRRRPFSQKPVPG